LKKLPSIIKKEDIKEVKKLVGRKIKNEPTLVKATIEM